MKKEYINALNLFRGLSIILVVFTHVNQKSLLSYSLGPYVSAFFSNGTFFFVFISGYLFWHLKNKYEYKKYLIGKFNNVIIPYFFILLPVLILCYIKKWFGVEQILYGNNSILYHLFVGGGVNAPLWFIPMIVLVFISSKLIFYISHSKLFYPILIISLLFTFTSFRPDNHVYPIYMYLHFIGVFLLGIFFKKIERFVLYNSFVISIFSFVIFVIFIFLEVRLTFDYNAGKFINPTFFPLLSGGEFKLNLYNIQKFFGVIFFLSLFFYCEGKVKFSLLSILAKYSFGIFFVHFYVIFILNKISNYFFPLKNFFIIAPLSLLLSLLFCMIVKKNFTKRSRQIIGC